jgi:hypothetical protein
VTRRRAAPAQRSLPRVPGPWTPLSRCGRFDLRKLLTAGPITAKRSPTVLGKVAQQRGNRALHPPGRPCA